MQIFIASDHRGLALKDQLVGLLSGSTNFGETPVRLTDLGPHTYDKDDDYNDAARAVAKAVLAEEKLEGRRTKPHKGENNRRDIFGILICGSSVGISIQANRFKGIRAACVSDLETAESSRAHNDANVLCLAADRIASAKDPLETETAFEDLQAVLTTFLTTPFSGEARHLRRIKRLDEETN